MASISTRELTKGGCSHTVTWRDPKTGLKMRTFADKDYGLVEPRDEALELEAWRLARTRRRRARGCCRLVRCSDKASLVSRKHPGQGHRVRHICVGIPYCRLHRHRKLALEVFDGAVTGGCKVWLAPLAAAIIGILDWRSSLNAPSSACSQGHPTVTCAHGRPAH